LTRPEATAEPTCGPGPFSMASADTTTDALVRAGFEDLSLHRCGIEIAIGADFDPAVEFVMALGRAGELIRLAGGDAEGFRSSIVAALREALAELEDPDAISGLVTSIGASTTGIGFPTPFCLASAPGPLAADRRSIVRGRSRPPPHLRHRAAPQLHPTVTAGGGEASHPARSYGASWRTAAPVDEQR
jgi:hypothetical protein